MSLSKETIKEFQEIVKADYGVDYDFQQAHDAAHRLVGYFDVLNNLYFEQKSKPNYDNNNRDTNNTN